MSVSADLFAIATRDRTSSHMLRRKSPGPLLVPRLLRWGLICRRVTVKAWKIGITRRGLPTVVRKIWILLEIAVFLKNWFFALYGFWEGLVWCEILPQGVGTICPYFWEVIFLLKSRSVNYLFSGLFLTFSGIWEPENSSIFNNFHRFSMIFIEFHRFSSIFSDFYRFSSIFKDFHRFSRSFYQNARRPVAPCGALWRRIGSRLTTFTRF